MRANALKVLIVFQISLILLIVNLTILTITRNSAILTSNNQDDPVLTSINASSSTPQIINQTIVPDDARALLLDQFIRTYQPNSPLLPYTRHIVEMADKYSNKELTNNAPLYTFDFRLVPAIAMCESNLGVRIPSKDSFNAWGIAVYTSQNKGKHFEDWPSAIEWVTKYIKEKFYDRGIFNLTDIGPIWAPPSEESGSWANCTQSFIDKIQ